MLTLLGLAEIRPHREIKAPCTSTVTVFIKIKVRWIRLIDSQFVFAFYNSGLSVFIKPRMNE